MPAPSYVYDLLADENLARWNGGAALGSPVTITYSFPTAQTSHTAYGNFTPFTLTEIAATRSALAYISAFTNITFVETNSEGELTFGNADLTAQGQGVSGRATYEYNQSGIQNAQVILSNTGGASLAGSDFAPGSITSNDLGGHGWGTLLHEIGHALGLKHPFQTNIAGDPNSVMPTQYDNLGYTIMSYTPYNPSNVAITTDNGDGTYSYRLSNLSSNTYALYDIAALQYLYGVDTAGSNKTYVFSPTTPTFVTISDAGVNNTIDCSTLTGPNRIDMQPGTFSDLSIRQTLPDVVNFQNRYDGTSALSIAYSAKVANYIGGSGVDDVTGNDLANRIDGRAGADVMAGGAGSDTYFVDNLGDRVIEANVAGIDTVNSSVSFRLGSQYIENLTLTGSANIDATGNSLANVLTGNSGANVLNGSGGADTMIGGAGADTYYVDNAGDRITEGNVAGIDLVYSSVSIGLGSQYIENVTLTGTAAINATGNSLANVLTGNSGANVLNGSTGADTMAGGAGADTYYVDSAGDRIVEGNVAGVDLVYSTVSIALGSQYIENVTLTGATAINATGNSLANKLIGNSGANVLNGSTGLDTMTGGAGADKFWFSTAASAANVDHITDFRVVDDTIQISRSVFSAITGTGTLTAAQFVANSTGTATNTNQHIIYNTSNGQLFYDTNGSTAGGSTLFAVIDNHATAGTLTNADFLII